MFSKQEGEWRSKSCALVLLSLLAAAHGTTYATCQSCQANSGSWCNSNACSTAWFNQCGLSGGVQYAKGECPCPSLSFAVNSWYTSAQLTYSSNCPFTSFTQANSAWTVQDAQGNYACLCGNGYDVSSQVCSLGGYWAVATADDAAGALYCYGNPCANVNCGAHGSCSGGACVCTGGWSGPSCSVAPDPCAGVYCGTHGYCSNGVCQCTDGYSGSSCSVAPAPPTPTPTPAAAWLGTFNVDNECSTASCCCMTGVVTLSDAGSGAISLTCNTLVGECGSASSLQALLPAPAGSSTSFMAYGSGYTATLSGDGNTITLTDLSAAQCSGAATRVGKQPSGDGGGGDGLTIILAAVLGGIVVLGLTFVCWHRRSGRKAEADRGAASAYLQLNDADAVQRPLSSAPARAV